MSHSRGDLSCGFGTLAGRKPCESEDKKNSRPSCLPKTTHLNILGRAVKAFQCHSGKGSLKIFIQGHPELSEELGAPDTTQNSLLWVAPPWLSSLQSSTCTGLPCAGSHHRDTCTNTECAEQPWGCAGSHTLPCSCTGLCHLLLLHTNSSCSWEGWKFGKSHRSECSAEWFLDVEFEGGIEMKAGFDTE